ncbi:MreB/Mbl protein [Actinomadura meyerae]|uniref:MreB/Mbl protein n=1 Tax=Actinomadura meyerae TaxID=240840 RepID=A0A239N4U4_9ACTN|nr:rod shape-determining protein [Actinomadura meyerae]SNT49189.1 MreB/Mbl protein [Actinomadura meyerae]
MTATAAAPDGARAALDLGTSRIRASVPALDVLVDRPSAAGDHVRAPAGRRTGRTAPARPIEHGIVTDAGACTRLTRRTLQEAGPGLRLRHILLAVPAAASGAQLGRAANAVRAAAGCPVRTMDAPLAAAIGAGIDPGDPTPRLILDIGAGIVEMAVIMRGRVHLARSIQYAPERPAGHNAPRLPEYVRERIPGGVTHLLNDLPAPLRRPARDGGLLLTGGGARLPSLPGRLTAEMSLTVTIAPDPARATIRGLARACRSPGLWQLTRT